MRRRWVATLALAALGCGDGDPVPAPAPSATVTPRPDAVALARRPSRRYYLGRGAARCEFYAVDLDGISKPTATPCPADLKIGERIRIAGSTCSRESSEPERREPVVCPDPLTNLEKRDRAPKL